MLKKTLLAVSALVALSVSSVANAVICSPQETVHALSFSITTTEQSFSPAASTYDVASSKQTASSVNVEEYGNLQITMDRCDDETGSWVTVRAQKRENMETTQEDLWEVRSRENICDEASIDFSKPIVLRGKNGAVLTVKARNNREARYTFEGKNIYGERVTLFATNGVGAYN